MFTREDTGLTLETLREQVNHDSTTVDRVKVDSIEFHLDAPEPVIAYKANGARTKTEIPASEGNLASVGTLLQIPSAFMGRMEKRTTGATQNAVLQELLHNTVQKDLAFERSNLTLLGIEEYDSTRRGIRPGVVVDTISKALEDAPVSPKIARVVLDRGFFGFDAYADAETVKNRSKKGTEWGVGGDKEVGDLTSAGVRVGVDLKRGLAPTIQPFSYRLICTNGMETPMVGAKIDARGQSVEEVLAELEEKARLAFAQAERDIESFYDMRNVKVDNPERTIRAIARERGIPNRSTMALIDLAATEEIGDEPTMFDVLNLVTNFANSPNIRNDGGRLILEQAAGAVVTDHAERCGHCQQRVVDL